MFLIPLNQHAHVYVLCLHALPWGDVVHPYKHGPCVVVGVLVSKWIHAIGTRTKHDVPWIFCSKSIYGVECSPPATIYEVSQPQIISIMRLLPLCVPAHELCFLRIYEILLQKESDRKVPYNFVRSFLSCLLVSRSIAH